jgi:hypothetical protein
MHAQIERAQKKRAQKKLQRKNRLVFFAICIIMLLAGLNSGFLYLMGAIADVVKVDTVAWEEAVNGQMWLFQKEVVVATEQQGLLQPVIAQGARASKGSLVAKINYLSGTTLATEGSVNMYSPMAGIVSYKVDGLELVDTEEGFVKLSVQHIEKAIKAYEAMQEAIAGGKTDAAKSIAAGSVVFKVTDNLESCYIYCRVDQDIKDWFIDNDTITVSAADGSEGVAVMKEYTPLDEGFGILLKLSSGLEQQRLIRQDTIKLIIKKQNKVAIQPAAIKTIDKNKGVFVYDKGYVQWRPVTIIEEQDKLLIVEGLKQDEWIILRPWFVRDGMRIKLRNQLI